MRNEPVARVLSFGAVTGLILTCAVAEVRADDRVSVELSKQVFDYWMKDGLAVEGPVEGWDFHVFIMASGSVGVERYWASGKPCIFIDTTTTVQLIDRTGVTHGVGYGPGDVGYTAGHFAGVNGQPVYDRSTGTADGCFFGMPVPADASKLVRVEGALSWYKAPAHLFVWDVALPIPGKEAKATPCGENVGVSLFGSPEAEIAPVVAGGYTGREPPPFPPPRTPATPLPPDLQAKLDALGELSRRASLRGLNPNFLVADQTWAGFRDDTKIKTLMDSYAAASPAQRPAILDELESEQLRREADLIEAERPHIDVVPENVRTQQAIEEIQARWQALGDYAEALIGVLGGLSAATPLKPREPAGPNWEQQQYIQRAPPTGLEKIEQFRQQARTSAGTQGPLTLSAADDPIRIINTALIAGGKSPYTGINVLEAVRRLLGSAGPNGHVSKGARTLAVAIFDPPIGFVALDARTGELCDIKKAVAARRGVPAARPGESQEASRSYGAWTRAAAGEWAAWTTSIYKNGEYGLQEPGNANAKGPDYITAVKNPDDGKFVIFVTDAKTTTTGEPGEIRSGPVPESWMNEVKDALSPARLGFDDPATEAGIRDAYEAGRVQMRRATVDYSSSGQGKVEFK